MIAKTHLNHFQVDGIDVHIFSDQTSLGMAAAGSVVTCISQVIQQRGEATFFLATGASQYDILDALCVAQGVDWSRVTAFHEIEESYSI